MREKMTSKLELIQRFIQDENGATAIEYSIIVAGITIAIVGAVTFLGSNVSSNYNDVQNAF
jgi:pilus assembly protein Flp/PilA